MSRIVQPDEFYDRLVAVLRHAVGQFGSVMGPGRSGALASVYASHLLGIPWLPYKRQRVPLVLWPTLIIDTATMSGRTLRKAARKILGPSETLALFQEPPRLRFWFESPVCQRPMASSDVLVIQQPKTTWVLATVTPLGPQWWQGLTGTQDPNQQPLPIEAAERRSAC